jgi:hypothetical protein
MRRGALTLGQVLEEEYEYVTGRSARCAEGESECWEIREHELVEVRGLFDEVNAANEITSRFCVLGVPITDDKSAASLRAAFAEQFNKLLRDNELATKLLKDEAVVSAVVERVDSCAALLQLPSFRRALVESPLFVSKLFGEDDEESAARRLNLADELDGGDQLTEIFKSSAFVKIARDYPHFFEALLADVELRQMLATSYGTRRYFAGQFATPKIKKGVDQKPATAKHTAILWQLTQRRAAMKLVADFETVARALDKTVDEPVSPDGLIRGNAILLEVSFADWIGPNRSVTAILRRMYTAEVAAICLSGGGIRSATFNLGVLQALSKRRVLGQMQYISTVSGGGYIGAWLSSWMRRHAEGADGAMTELASRTGDPIEAEPQPLRYLRDYSRYLAPRAGIFTVDLWTIVAIYVRNLLLNWTLLLPALFALLLLPRLAEWWLVQPPPFNPTTWSFASASMLIIAMVLFAGLRPTVQVVTGNPLSSEELRSSRRWTMFALMPVVLVAVLIALGVGWHLRAVRSGAPIEWKHANVLWVARSFFLANFLGALLYVGRYIRSLKRYDDRALTRKGWESIRAPLARSWWEIVGAGGAAVLMWTVIAVILPLNTKRWLGVVGAEVYVTLSVPLLLALFILEGAILLGITTRWSSEHEREWIARAASGLMLAGLAWIAVTGTALLVPIALYQSPKMVAALGGLSGVIALLTGRSAKTAANVTTRETTSAGRPFGLIIGTAATICLIVIGGAVSIVTTKILPSIEKAQLRRMGAAARANLTPKPPQATREVKHPPPAAKTQPLPSRITFNADIFPAEGTDYNVKISSTTESSIWTLRKAAVRHVTELRGYGNLLTWALLIAIVVSIATSWLIDVNAYSMHSMYRNRLIRAYLGASRRHRRPHPFTGFDPQDDLQMHQLRPELLWRASFRDFKAFVEQMKTRGQPAKPGVTWSFKKWFLSLFKREEKLEKELSGPVDLWDVLSDRVRATAQTLLDSFEKSARDQRDADMRDLVPIILGEINDKMHELDFRDGFKAAVPSPALLRRNRAWIDEIFGECMKKNHDDPGSRNPPLHLINIALNLVRGEKLAWQQRKAESFSISPLHAGSHHVGYRDTREYGGKNGGISLGTAVAISGAAVSPNMGYHSSNAVTALMTIFNARLGWWLGNPGPIGEDTFMYNGPSHAITPMFREATGMTHDHSPWVFLSDGGHFENLGLYEMVLRRCKYIIVCDVTADDKYAFDDLANAIRKIRIDLGIPIDFEAIHIEPPDESDPGSATARRYCAAGRIRYSVVDDPSHSPNDKSKDGRLVYIKPVVYPDCPVDIRNYRKASPLFPHESTGHQFFSETQFESYRALGAHCIEQILGESNGSFTVPKFFDAAFAYARREESGESKESCPL